MQIFFSSFSQSIVKIGKYRLEIEISLILSLGFCYTSVSSLLKILFPCLWISADGNNSKEF